MRTNLPVTPNEYLLRDDQSIVSKTDPKGRITFVNQDFLDVSGYTEQELLGEPHNIVRHPDMPAEAFADLWDTLKAGRPWVGCVKNRRKNGDYYWVEAHAAPIWDGDQVVGYMSVRRKPDRDAVAACEAVYAKLRQGTAQGLRIELGTVVGTSPLARLRRRLADTSVANKLVVACAIAVLIVMTAGIPLLNHRIGMTLSKQAEKDLIQQVGQVRAMMESTFEAVEREAVRLLDIYAARYTGSFAIDGNENGVPLLRHARTLVNGHHEQEDAFAAITRGPTATVLVRRGDEFVRVATSQRNDKGERVVNTVLDKEGPVTGRLLAGEVYVGRTTNQGKERISALKPIKDESGKVIGAFGIGYFITQEMTALRERVKAVKVGETGYIFVIEAQEGRRRGELFVHPAKEGSNILAAKDAGGREFIREMLDRKEGLIVYPWQNAELGETAARDKIAAFATLPRWKLLVGGGSYIDEFDAVSRQVGFMVAGGGAFLVLLLVGMVYFLVRRLVTMPLQATVLTTFRSLSAGNYDTRLDVTAHDEIGQVRQGLETMQNRLGFEVADARRKADEMTRIKIALENVSTPVRIADAGGQVIYANTELKNTLRRIEPALREQNSNFSVDTFVGSSIGNLYADPDAAIRKLASLTGTVDTVMDIGGRTFRVVTSPVFTAEGERLGSVGEWQDRTEQLVVEREIAGVVGEAEKGILDRTIGVEGKEGFFLTLAEGINGLLKTTQEALRQTSAVLSRVAQGDLTRTIDNDYAGIFGQLREDTNASILRLRAAIGRIREATDAINTAAQEIAAGNQDLSRRTEEQASSLEKTASSMEELNATVKQNAVNAERANDLAGTSNEIAGRGGELVKQVVSTMTAIQGGSRKIADIVGVIDSIAFQTNILALNAAVEAARAGEQGRGFAVVATEVRNLAQRSATAAKEIKSLIAQSVGKIEGGAELVQQAGDTMDEVVDSFRQVASLVTDISSASREQSSGIEQVTQAVGQMDEVTQQNAALVEEAAAAAESLEEQVRGLAQAVGMFKLPEGMAAAAWPGPP